MALYKDVGPDGYLTKKELQEAAQQYADCLFVQTSSRERYSAWSAMSGLIKKNLVEKRSNPAKFNLSESGRALAGKLDRAESELQGITVSRMSLETSTETPLIQRTLGTEVIPKKQVTSSISKRTEPIVVPCAKDLQKVADDIVFLDDDEFGDIIPLSSKPNVSVGISSNRTDYISPIIDKENIHEDFSFLRPNSPKDESNDIMPLYSSSAQHDNLVRSISLDSITKCQDQQSTDNSVDEEVDGLTSFDRITLDHGQYDVILCVDTAEVSGYFNISILSKTVCLNYFSSYYFICL